MSIIASRTQDGTLNVLCAGNVVRDPEIKHTKNGDRVKFSVCYAKGKFMDCEAWADSDAGAVAGCLEKGDVIGVMGTHRTWEYNEKTYSTLSVDMVFTMAAPLAAPIPEQEADLPPSTTTYEQMMDTDGGELPF